MSKTSLNMTPEKLRFRAMIGTGGIGAGSLFLLHGNHTLGREESRGGRYLDARDYCKLHIIAHYVKTLCGESFPVYPIGKIGDDDVGRGIVREMEQAGLHMDYVHTSPGDKTLFGFCFLYPDGTGGNLTTEESACAKVDSSFVTRATPFFSKYRGTFISLSAPEVPLEGRMKLLELTKQFNGFSVASFTSGEIAQAEKAGMLSLVDLLAVNIEEAGALTGSEANHKTPGEIVERTIARMMDINPAAQLSITAGRNGSWAWDGKSLTHAAIFPAEVKSSAGAGDAHIAGIIAGLTAGLRFSQAQVLGNLAGAFSVTSQHTIHPDMGKDHLRRIALLAKESIDPEVLALLDE